MMRIALHEMLMGKLDDENHTITLFPSWPADRWDVSFKLHGVRYGPYRPRTPCCCCFCCCC